MTKESEDKKLGINISKWNLIEKPLGNLWWSAIQKLRRNVEGVENLHALDGQSCIFIYNHLAIQDAMFIYDAVNREPGLEDYRFTIPTSIKFWDGRMKFPGARGVMEKLRIEQDVKFVEVVQHYDNKYDGNKRSAYNRRMINCVVDDLNTPKKIVPLSPEGGRSSTRAMQRAQRGIEVIMELVPENTLVMPVATWGSERVVPYKRIGVPKPFHVTELRFMAPMKVNQIIQNAEMLEIEPRDYLMCRLTDVLPREYWGVYNQNTFPRYFEEKK